MDLLLTIRLPAALDNLNRIIGPLSDCARDHGFSEERISQIELAVEEALVNVFNYAYPETPGEVEVRCQYDGGDGLVVEIVDWGVPFDVLSLEDPDLSSDIPDRKIGGLGVFMIRTFVDDMTYQRIEGKNLLVLTIRKIKQ